LIYKKGAKNSFFMCTRARVGQLLRSPDWADPKIFSRGKACGGGFQQWGRPFRHGGREVPERRAARGWQLPCQRSIVIFATAVVANMPVSNESVAVGFRQAGDGRVEAFRIVV